MSLYYRRCIDCQKIIYLSSPSCEQRCYECKMKENRESCEMKRINTKCPSCGHEWFELEPFEDLEED